LSNLFFVTKLIVHRRVFPGGVQLTTVFKPSLVGGVLYQGNCSEFDKIVNTVHCVNHVQKDLQLF